MTYSPTLCYTPGYYLVTWGVFMSRNSKESVTEFRLHNKVALIVYWTEDGVEWEIRKPLRSATPAEKEQAAYWLSKELLNKSQDDCYHLLFGN